METFVGSWLFYGLLSFVPLLYWYATRTFNYWSKRGLIGPKPYPFVGNQIDQLIRPKPYVELDWFKKFGKLYGIYNGLKPAITVAEPELIKNILVKDFHLFTDRQKGTRLHPILSKHLVAVGGEDWKRIRAIASPTFSSGKMKKMYPMVKNCLNEFLDALDVYAKEGREVNVKDAYGNYTMDVIATCAFATKTNAHKDPNNQFIKSAVAVFNPKIYRLAALLILPRSVLKAIKFYSLADESANQFFFDLTRHIIKERKNSHKKYNDFIDLLINAEKDINNKNAVDRDENDVAEAHHVNEGQEELDSERKALSGVTEKYITEDEMLAQAWVFFNAGYETTATTLTFASYELALNPDIQERLYEEVMTSVDSNGLR